LYKGGALQPRTQEAKRDVYLRILDARGETKWFKEQQKLVPGSVVDLDGVWVAGPNWCDWYSRVVGGKLKQ
jgi:hypothetical protein